MNDRLTAYNARRALDRERQKRKRQEAMRVRPEFVQKASDEGQCRCCLRATAIDAHHIVHRSKLRGMKGHIRDDLRNSMALCRDCHSLYHAGKMKFDRSMLSQSEVEFILQYAGQEWLDKVYPERENGRPIRNGRRRASAPNPGLEAAIAAGRLGLRTGYEAEADEANEKHQHEGEGLAASRDDGYVEKHVQAD